MTLINKKWEDKLNIDKCSLVCLLFKAQDPWGWKAVKEISVLETSALKIWPLFILVGSTYVYGIFLYY